MTLLLMFRRKYFLQSNFLEQNNSESRLTGTCGGEQFNLSLKNTLNMNVIRPARGDRDILFSGGVLRNSQRSKNSSFHLCALTCVSA